MSEGLARARAPFRTRNFLTAGVITSFVLSVYFYSISAVKQDDFSDVALPSDAERATAVSIEDEAARKLAIKREVVESLAFAQTPASAPAAPGGPGSLLQQLRGKFGGKGTDSGLVANAPDVDRLGRTGGGAGDVPAKRVV